MFFCSSRIRTLVAMATYSSHRLMIGKEEIDNFVCHWGYLDFYFMKIFIESSSTFIQLLSKSVNLIGCWGCKKG